MRRFSRNFLAIFISDILRRFLGFFAVAYLARRLGTASFGAINIAFTILSYGLIVSTAGLASYGTRAIARGEQPGLVNRILSIRFLNAILAYLLIAGAALWCVPNPLNARLILVFSLSLFASSMMLDWYYQGKEAMGVIGTARLVSALLYLLLILAAVHSPNDILWVGAAAVTGDAAAALAMFIFYRKDSASEPFRFTINGWKPMLRQALPMGTGSIMATFSLNLSPIVIGILLSNHEAGLFSAASKLVFFLLMLDRVLGTLMLPASARLLSRSKEELAGRLSFALKWIILLGLPVCVGGTLLGAKIVNLVYGIQFTGAAAVFEILIWFFLLTMVHTVYTSGLIAAGEERRYSITMVASGVLYLVFTVTLTYFFGEAGAAAGMVAAEGTTVILMRSQFRRFIRLTPSPAVAVGILAALTMGISIYLLPQASLFVGVAIGAAVYGIILFLFRAVTVADIRNFATNI